LAVIDIRPVRTEREIRGVPVRMEHLQADQRAQSAPPNGTVTVRGDDDALRALGAGGVEASVDLKGLGAGRYTLPVHVAPSRLFGVVRVDPPQVQITIR
jgi:YbbR domain-containing protein